MMLRLCARKISQNLLALNPSHCPCHYVMCHQNETVAMGHETREMGRQGHGNREM